MGIAEHSPKRELLRWRNEGAALQGGRDRGRGLALFALTATGAQAALHGKYVAKTPEAKIKLKLKRGEATNKGSLRVRGASGSDTVGHLYEMKCGKRRGNKHLVFAISPITPANPIKLFGAEDLKGPRCKITVDQQPWTKFMLRKK